MRSSNLELHSIAPRLALILTIVVALVGTLFIGAAIGQGQFIYLYLLLCALAGLTVILALGSKYWLLIPIAFSLNLPVIPFGGRAFELPELAIGLCTIVFAARYALYPRDVFVFRPAHSGVMLYTAWAAVIFALHPIGLSVMGSSLGGARFYFKIALALASFLIVANQKITERDAKWMIRLLLVGSIVGMAVGIARYKIFGSIYENPNGATEEYYTWHQEMALPAMWIMIGLVARYKTKEFFNLGKPWILLLAILCIAVGAISGKRAAFASVLLAPFIAAIIRKEYSYVFVGAVLGTMLIAVLTLGQGELFRLPLQAQRTLSYLPGKWDQEVQAEFQSGIDPFRKEMRELAWNNIKKRPLVGGGYAVNMHELWGIAGRGDLHMFTVLTLALGSSWHNTWLGIWADFGLPAVFFWALFWIQTVAIGFWIYRRILHASPYRTLTLMILLWFIILICRSWTSGHSAEDAYLRWWMFGVLVSLKHNTLERGRPSTPAAGSARLRPAAAAIV
jgi:O-antigen ligase